MSWWGTVDADFTMAEGSQRDPFDGMPLGSEWEWGAVMARTPSSDPERDAEALRKRRPCNFSRYQKGCEISGGARLRDFIDHEDAEDALAWVTATCADDCVEARIVVEFDGGPRYVWRYAEGKLSREHGVLDEHHAEDARDKGNAHG